MSDPDATTRKLDEVESKLKSEGVTSVDELIQRTQTQAADLKQAEEARDKFSDDLKEARKNLGSKGGELGFLKQENDRLQTENDEMKQKLNGQTPSEQKSQGRTPTSTPSDTPEDKLAEVENSLTDAQWDVADQLLQAVEDSDTADKLVNNPTERLKFLTDVKSRPEFKERPTSFRRKPSKEPEKKDTGSLVDKLMKEIGRTPPGPAVGGAARRGSGGKPKERMTHPALK